MDCVQHVAFATPISASSVITVSPQVSETGALAGPLRRAAHAKPCPTSASGWWRRSGPTGTPAKGSAWAECPSRSARSNMRAAASMADAFSGMTRWLRLVLAPSDVHQPLDEIHVAATKVLHFDGPQRRVRGDDRGAIHVLHSALDAAASKSACAPLASVRDRLDAGVQASSSRHPRALANDRTTRARATARRRPC